MGKTIKVFVLGLYALGLLISLAGINGFIQAVSVRQDGNWLRVDYLANSFIPMALLSAIAIWFQLRRLVDWAVLAGYVIAGVPLFMSAVNHALPDRAAPFAMIHIIFALLVVVLITWRIRTVRVIRH